MMNDTITVDRDALFQVLQALVGPGHLIRELQFTRGLPDNPINKLVDQYNAFVAQENGYAD
jgi:hypothetical protein